MDFTFQKASFSASKCEAFQVDTPPKTNMEPENTPPKKKEKEKHLSPNHPILGFQILLFRYIDFFFRLNTTTATATVTQRQFSAVPQGQDHLFPLLLATLTPLQGLEGDGRENQPHVPFRWTKKWAFGKL